MEVAWVSEQEAAGGHVKDDKEVNGQDEYRRVADAIDRDRWIGGTDTMAIRDGKGKHPPGAVCPEGGK
jgi:hypothetical protein